MRKLRLYFVLTPEEKAKFDLHRSLTNLSTTKVVRPFIQGIIASNPALNLKSQVRPAEK
jgi:hypothetical protein